MAKKVQKVEFYFYLDGKDQIRKVDVKKHQSFYIFLVEKMQEVGNLHLDWKGNDKKPQDTPCLYLEPASWVDLKASIGGEFRQVQVNIGLKDFYVLVRENRIK
jgi:hypothetical protein